jgi:hypothetical protein
MSTRNPSEPEQPGAQRSADCDQSSPDPEPRWCETTTGTERPVNHEDASDGDERDAPTENPTAGRCEPTGTRHGRNTVAS